MDRNKKMEAFSVFLKLIGMWLVAFVGVFLRHYKNWRQKHHKFFGPELLIGAIVAVFAGFLGSGIAEYFDLGPNATVALVSALGYVGPNFLDRVCEELLAWIKRK